MAEPGSRVSGDSDHGRLDNTIASCTRPFVLITERELSVLRRGLVKQGWKRILYLQPARQPHGLHVGAGLLSVANRALETDVRNPGRSGHFHDFFCDCGSALAIPEDLTTRSSYACPACGQHYSGDEYDAAIRHIQHNELAGAALALALVYGIEKDRAYAHKAAEILLQYAQAYTGPHTDPTAGRILDQSLCEALWVIPLAQAYDLIYGVRTFTDADKAVVEDRLLKPVARGLMGLGNEGAPGAAHLSAVGVIGLATKDVALLEHALDSFRARVREQPGDDGYIPDVACGHHFHPLSAFVHLAEGCARAGIDLYNPRLPSGGFLSAMFTAPLQHAYPSFRLPAVNDGMYDAFIPLDLYEIAHRRWDDPLFAWVLKQGYKYGRFPLNRDHRDNPQAFSRSSFYAFLFGRDLPGRSNPPKVPGRSISSLGICALRSDDLMATLDCGHHQHNAHFAKLSFTMYANDSLVVPDYGAPGAGSKIIDYYRSTAAHNTVVVDGKTQQPIHTCDLKYHYSGSFLHCAEAAAENIYPGVTHSRKLLIIGGVVLILDSLESEQPHDYDWLIRCEGEPQVVGDYPPAQLDFSSYPHAEVHRALRASGRFRLDWKCENGKLAFAIWNIAGETSVGLGSCPAETTRRDASFLVCRHHATSARFLAVLAPTLHSENLDLAKDGGLLKITGPDRADHILMRNGDDQEPSGPLQADGGMAVVCTRGDRIVRVALDRGCWVKWHGQTLLECSSPANCVEVSFANRIPEIRYSADTPAIIKVKTTSRSVRVNGYRAAATTSDGYVILRVTPETRTQDTGASRA